MNITYPLIYVAACLVIALLGRGRLMGFFGFLVLGLAVHPLAALVVLILTAPFSWGGPRKPRFRPLRPYEERPWLPRPPEEPFVADPSSRSPIVEPARRPPPRNDGSPV